MKLYSHAGSARSFSFVVEHMNVVVIVALAGFPFHDAGAVLPVVPQALHDIDEFSGDLVAKIVLDHDFASKVHRRFVRGGSDDIPPGARPPEMIEQSELPGNGECLSSAYTLIISWNPLNSAALRCLWRGQPPLHRS
jgi:hypothetical protein